MEKKHFVFKLYPPRPTFHLDMTDEEKTIMNEHMVYWNELIERGAAIVYGPVFDPKGVYGMAIIEAEDDVAAHEIAKNDPTVASTLGSFELIPMQVGMVRK